MKRYEQLDETTTPDGTVLTLSRHDGAYYIRADGTELMSTRRHHSEEELAALVCAPLRDTSGARVLIGGLGLGFTLRAALAALGADAQVVVVELLEAVIRWNREPAYALSTTALGDPRVTLLHDDVARVLAASRDRFDGIMMDVDNGTDAITTAANRKLYRSAGIRSASAALRGKGRVAYWSAGADAALEDALRREGLGVSVSTVRAYGTGGAKHYLYLAQRMAI